MSQNVEKRTGRPSPMRSRFLRDAGKLTLLSKKSSMTLARACTSRHTSAKAHVIPYKRHCVHLRFPNRPDEGGARSSSISELLVRKCENVKIFNFQASGASAMRLII